MRLLHTKSLTLEEFIGGETPHYAILSHTWGKEEVTLQDMKTDPEKLKGYAKVKNACSVALADGFEYIWIDTCCIDKTSSAELSEALNSMYRWYEEADECYAYLADTLPWTVNHTTLVPSGFQKSRWFTRGWTLQELIAPSTVIFLDMNWQEIGSKSSLQELISEITGIPGGFLLGDDLGYASVAQRMSWASKRETTRVEDQAYCLMGIFGIFMPMLYGEGERAFIRLQEEIIRISDDHSLFAWMSTDEDHDGIFASSPTAFASCNNIVQTKPFNSVNSPPTISSRGIRLSLPFEYNDQKDSGLAVLNCTEVGKESMRLAISLRDVFLTSVDFEKERGSKPTLLHLRDINTPHYPPKDLYVKQWRSARNKKGEDVEKCVIKLEGEDVASYLSDLHSDWELHDGMMITTVALPRNGILARLLVRCKDGNSFQVLLKKFNRFLSAAIDDSFDTGSQPDQNPISPEHQQHERDRIVKPLGGGKHVHVAIKRRVLMLRKKKHLVGMVELSYSSAISGMWIEHVALLAGGMEERTPLLHAVEQGHAAAVQLLLNTGKVDIRAEDKYGETPLSWVVQHGNVLGLKLLLDNGVNLEKENIRRETPLFWAIQHGNVLGLKLLLDNGVNLEKENMKRETPLFWAVQHGNVSVVKLLLDNGAKLEKENSGRETPLFWAVRHGNVSVVKLLLDKGANLEKENIKRETPLFWAAGHGNVLVVKLLLGNGAILEKRSIYGVTPLFRAVEHGNVSVVKLLLDKGANLEKEDIDRETPILWAVRHGNMSVVKLLLDNGANLNKQYQNGSTLLIWAKQNRGNPISELLRVYGGKLEKKIDI